MFLIDTDVLSALRRQEQNPGIAQWISNQRAADLHLSIVSVGEIERGIARQTRWDPAFARSLAMWLDGLLRLYDDRILPVDVAIVRRWGRLASDLGHDDTDLLIAATALERGLTVVTRNVRRYRSTGVPALDPSAHSV